MIKTILVPASGEAQDEAAYPAALAAARLFGAHLTFLHVRADPADLLAAPSEGDLATGLALPGFIAAFKNESRLRAERAKGGFERFCRRARLALAESPSGARGATAAWREAKGYPLECLVAEARLHDLLVLRNAKDRDGLTASDLGAILIGAGRPLLLVPQAAPKALPGTVVIAWKETAEAARALAAAIPFLATAREIVVLNVAEGHGQEAKAVKRVAGALAWHGLKASARHLSPGKSAPAETLVAAAEKLGAGMLVAGGYGHSRLRELIFGGFTQRLLHGIGIPVLLFH